MCASSSTEKIRQPSGRGVTFALAVLACLLAVITVGPSIVWHIRQLGNRFLSSGQVLIVHDLGPVLVETPTAADASRPPPRIAHRFTIENPSPHQSLRLALEKRSCGCLSVTEPEPIPPNGTGQVELAFVPTGQSELRSESASWSNWTTTPPMRSLRPERFSRNWVCRSTETLIVLPWK
ncbi:MAG: hypothetical protein KatS3mg110_3785 [Pirellulaceae bacterium]|nr:MAG: hypothetical protein KatS3mg110_3772 [Pirellulaceae bacterium]GIW95744.1 MAG: hypothetical protein KatS3mg110_3785 [Pirellulaceae bacterium]